MFSSFRHLLGWIISAFYSRQDLILENLALRGQLLALHAKRPRHRLSARQKMFWVLLQRLWSGWKAPLVLVTPPTVVQWHRAGFRLYWKWLSRTRQVCGRKPISQELRALIFRMVAENPTWGAPRIHGELLKLGFQVSENPPSRVGCGGHPGALILASAGLAFFATTARQLRPWTSLPFRRSPSGSCIVSSSSATTAAEFCA